MGAKQKTIKVTEVPGEPMRYWVESWTAGQLPHMVDLAACGGHGDCSCTDAATTVARNRKLHPGKWNDYGHPGAINPDRCCCRHVAAARKRFLMTTLPAIAAKIYPPEPNKRPYK